MILFPAEPDEPEPSQLRFEAKRVEMVLRAFKMEDRIQGLLNHHHKTEGVYRLTFHSFFATFPTFPIRLEAEWLYDTNANNSWLKMRSLFDQFHKTFIYKRYMHHLGQHTENDPDAVSANLPFGLVFPFYKIRGGMILHNAAAPFTNGLKFVDDGLDEDQRPLRLWVEKFSGCVDVLALRGWKPSTPLPKLPRGPRKRPIKHAGSFILPWMVQLCEGIGPEAYLLGWLLRMNRKGASSYQLSRRVRTAEGVWLTFLQEPLAKSLGLSHDQFKRALTKLRGRGFIHSERRSVGGLDVRTHVMVDIDAIKQARDAIT